MAIWMETIQTPADNIWRKVMDLVLTIQVWTQVLEMPKCLQQIQWIQIQQTDLQLSHLFRHYLILLPYPPVSQTEMYMLLSSALWHLPAPIVDHLS